MQTLFARLDAYAIAATVAAGAMLFRRGDPVTGAYTIRRGKVALVWTAADGVNPMDTLGPGSIIGLPAVLNGEYSLSARAVEDCRLGFIPASRVTDLLCTDRTMLQEVTKLLAAEVARMRNLVSPAVEEPVIDISKRRGRKPR